MKTFCENLVIKYLTSLPKGKNEIIQIKTELGINPGDIIIIFSFMPKNLHCLCYKKILVHIAPPCSRTNAISWKKQLIMKHRYYGKQLAIKNNEGLWSRINLSKENSWSLLSPLPGLPVSNLLTLAHSPQIFLQLVLSDDVTRVLNTSSQKNPANLPHEALKTLANHLKNIYFQRVCVHFHKI